MWRSLSLGGHAPTSITTEWVTFTEENLRHRSLVKSSDHSEVRSAQALKLMCNSQVITRSRHGPVERHVFITRSWTLLLAGCMTWEAWFHCRLSLRRSISYPAQTPYSFTLIVAF